MTASHYASLHKTGGLQKEQVPFSMESGLGPMKPQPSCSPQPAKEAVGRRQRAWGLRAQQSCQTPPCCLPHCKQLWMWPVPTQNHTWNGILGKEVPTTKLTHCTSFAASSRDISLGDFPGFTVLALNPCAICNSALLWVGVIYPYQWKNASLFQAFWMLYSRLFHHQSN